MHDPRLAYIYMRKDSLLQCMHKAAIKHGTRLIPEFHFDAKENEVLISLNRCGMVRVGLGASLKGGNQIWSEKEYFYTFKL